MKFRFSVVITFVIINLATNHSVAQDTAKDTTIWSYVGGYAGFNLNQHSADFRALPGVPNCCPQYAEGDGTGFSLGVLFELPLSENFGIQFRAGLSQRNGTLDRTESIGNTLVSDGSNEFSTEVLVEHTLEGTLNYAGIEPALRYNVAGGIVLNVGMAAGFWVTSDYKQQEELKTPANVVFTGTGSRTRNESAGAIPEAESLYLAAMLGAGYELPVGTDTYLVPELRYYLPLSNVSSVDWKVGGLQLGAAIKFPLKLDMTKYLKDTVYIRDTVEQVIAGLDAPRVRLSNSEESFDTERKPGLVVERTTYRENYTREVPRPFQLRPGLRVYGVGEDGRRRENPTLTIEEQEVGETLPMLPYIFFAEAAADLAGTRTRELGAAETAAFEPAKLSAEALNMYANTLNILGYRMKRKPGSSITITGCNSNIAAERGNTELSRKRAETVRNYLADVWGIARNRMSVQSRNLPEKYSNNDIPDGQAENRRVEISTSDAELLEPVTINEINRTAVPPVLEIETNVYAEAGLQQWKLEARQSGTLLRSFEGSDTAAVKRWEILEEPKPTDEKDIAIGYNVVDGSGNRERASASVPVRQLTISKKRVEIKEDKRIAIFSLILFDFGKADLDGRNRRIMNEVRKSIEPNSMVTVYGYADRTGDADFNRELAARRCRQAAEALEGSVPPDQINVIAVGSDELIYDNDLPEGRSYSRTVRIVIETPVTE